ncbi:MAG: antitoxin [Anaerolineae bacterium]|nr:antitoxin [Candidatus Roseilinea sp.]MDW8449714.1 antitoxin [Anaerolineae bacterium]
MKDTYLAAAERIRRELVGIRREADKASRNWQRAKVSGDEAYVDSVALSLHSFYTGVERVFEMIATSIDQSIDQSMPSGEHWHQALLEQMANESPGVRPAVIGSETQTALNELRRFRHVVRNAYTYDFDPVKLEAIVSILPTAEALVNRELSAFADFWRL